MAVLPLINVAISHHKQVLSFCISRAFHATNDIIVTATLITKFGPSGLSSIAYSMMNTFGCLSIFVFCWIVGIYLDYEGASLMGWSYCLIVVCCMNVALILVYVIFIDSEAYVLKDKKKTKDVEGQKTQSTGNNSGLTRQYSHSSATLARYASVREDKK